MMPYIVRPNGLTLERTTRYYVGSVLRAGRTWQPFCCIFLPVRKFPTRAAALEVLWRHYLDEHKESQ